ncbi:MAG: chromate efflux transporter [Actinobacteria bacterium]|nr:chromate efflux transporter [Actinomycetota bacterium]
MTTDEGTPVASTGQNLAASSALPGNEDNASGKQSGASSAPSPVSIFLTFLRLGITGFGGPAMLHHIRKMVVKRKHWISGEDFKGGLALCQAIPGATGMQVSAYVGLKKAGFAGASAAYAGFGLPAFLTMLVLSVLYRYGHNIGTVQALLTGLQAIVVALVFNAAIAFGRSSVTRWWQLAIVAGAAAALILHVNPIFVIIGAGIVGLALPVPGAHEAPDKPATASTRKYHLRHLAILLGAAAVVVGLLFVLDRQLFSLATTMLRIDLFAFGGGFASVPLMQHEFVDVMHWVPAKVFIDGIALGQVTPGPILVTATFVGLLVAGFLGSVVATLAIFLPSFVILILVQPHFDRMRASRMFSRTVHGVLLAFVGLLLAVTYRLGLSVPWAWGTILLGVAAFVALRMKVDVLWVVIVGALAALLVVR